MRLAAVMTSDGWAIGTVDLVESTIAIATPELGTVDDVVRGRITMAEISSTVDARGAKPLNEVVLGSPLGQFNRDILCTGWNYVDHFYESAGRREGQDPDRLPDHPTFFTKGPDTVIGPYESISFDEVLSTKWDYEAEIALVIGQDGRSIHEEQALDHVFGWLVANDVSQRDLQRAHGGQWLKGKSVDRTMPLGPWLTTADEIDNFESLQITCELNGHLLQCASAGDMAFSVSRIISELSRGMTLRRGDVVLTGTPSGIGNARDPAVFLSPGDTLVTSVSDLGTLRNTVAREDLTGFQC